MSDWADTEDHDYLNEWVGKRIINVETGKRGVWPWVRLTFGNGRTVEIEAEYDPRWGVDFTVQDIE